MEGSRSFSAPPRHAMVLAAGLGTRMRPFNGQIPKPLVKVGGKALIDYVLDRLSAAGVERAVINVHHLADQLEWHLASRQRPQIMISDERRGVLGTRGGGGQGPPPARGRPLLPPQSDPALDDGGAPH